MKGVRTIHISYSRESCYLHCPYQHWLRYVKRLDKKKPERPLYFGSDFHKLLELRNQPKELKKARQKIKDTYYDMPASWQADLGENYLDALFSIFKDYQRVYKDTKQPQVTEQEFELVVGKHKGEPITFVGKIDELYLPEDQEEPFIVGEHKTFTRKPNMDVLVMNTQKCLYAKAVQFVNGMLPQKVKWDYICSTPASEPVWLVRSNRFSEAASTKITPMSWERACKSKGITDPEILAKGKRYEPNIQEFFFQVELELDPKMIETIWDGFIYTARHIIQFGEKNKTHNVTRDCSWCPYHDICYAEMTGGDPDYVIKRDFTERT